MTRPEAYSIIDRLAARFPPGAWQLPAHELVQWLEGIADGKREGASRDERKDAKRVAKAVYKLEIQRYAF